MPEVTASSFLPVVTASSFLPARTQEKFSTSHLGRLHFSCFNLWLSRSRSSPHLLSQSLVELQEYPWQKSHSLTESSSAAAPPQKSLGAGEWEFSLPHEPIVSDLFSVRPLCVLYPSFALPQLSTTQEFPAEENRHVPPNYTCTY